MVPAKLCTVITDAVVLPKFKFTGVTAEPATVAFLSTLTVVPEIEELPAMRETYIVLPLLAGLETCKIASCAAVIDDEKLAENKMPDIAAPPSGDESIPGAENVLTCWVYSGPFERLNML